MCVPLPAHYGMGVEWRNQTMLPHISLSRACIMWLDLTIGDITRWLTTNDHCTAHSRSTALLAAPHHCLRAQTPAAPFISWISSPAQFIIGQLLLTLGKAMPLRQQWARKILARFASTTATATSGSSSAGRGRLQNAVEYATFNLTHADSRRRSSDRRHFIVTVDSDETKLHLLDKYSNRTVCSFQSQQFTINIHVNTNYGNVKNQVNYCKRVNWQHTINVFQEVMQKEGIRSYCLTFSVSKTLCIQDLDA